MVRLISEHGIKTLSRQRHSRGGIMMLNKDRTNKYRWTSNPNTLLQQLFILISSFTSSRIWVALLRGLITLLSCSSMLVCSPATDLYALLDVDVRISLSAIAGTAACAEDVEKGHCCRGGEERPAKTQSAKSTLVPFQVLRLRRDSPLESTKHRRSLRGRADMPKAHPIT